MWRTIKRWGITTRMVLLFAFLNLVVVGIEGYLVFHHSSELLTKKILNELGEEADIHGRLFQNRIVEYQQDVGFLANTPPIHGIMRALHGNGIDPVDGSTTQFWIERLQSIFETFLTSHPNYFQARFIGAKNNGREIVRAHRVQDSVVVVSSNQLQSKGDRDYFKEAIALPPGSIYFSRINLNREQGRISEPHIPTLRIASPVHSTVGEPFGIVVINVDLTHDFTSLKKAVSQPGKLYMTNHQGDFLIHPDPGLAFAFEFGSSHRLQTAHPEWYRSYQSLDEHSEQKGQIILEAENHVRVISRFPLFPGQQDHLLGLIMEQPRATVLDELRVIRKNTLTTSLILLVLGLILVWIVTRHLTKPLKQMTHAVRAFAANKALVDLPLQQHDEIGVLARSFDEMARDVSRSQQETEERNERLRTVLDTVIDGIIVIDTRGRVSGFSPSAERIFGYSAEEVIGHNVKMLMPEPFHSKHDSYLHNYLSSGHGKILGTTGREVIGKRKDGSTFPLDLAVAQGHIGEERFFTGIIRDISTRKQMEKEVQEQEARLRLILDNTVDGIITINHHGIIESFNQAATKLFGYAAEEVIGSNVKILMPEPHRSRHEEYIRRYLETGIPRIVGGGAEVNAIRKNGTLFPVYASISELRINNEIIFIGLLRDLTKEKEREAELLKLSSVVEKNPNAVVLTDPAGEIEYINEMFSTLTGYNSDEVVGRNISLLNAGTGPKGRSAKLWKRIQSGKIWRGEFRNRRKDGSLYWAGSTISPLYDETGTIKHYVGVSRDISKQKEMERQARIAREEKERSDQLLKLSIESIQDGFAILDADKRLKVWNAPFLELNGQLSDSVISGTPFADLLNRGVQNGLFANLPENLEEWMESWLKDPQ
ncbi:MAG: PAS domain S-box protein, partial [Magnetococcales bacterium]|nr:PAS domain S-box protein [Magnetococcales bacterium]